MSPDQIKEVRYLYNETKQASAVVEKVPAKPVASVIAVDLSPGATPPVIRLASGFVSSLIFLDSTGAPWPIKAFDIGDPQSFNIQWEQGTPAEEKAGQEEEDAAARRFIVPLQVCTKLFSIRALPCAWTTREYQPTRVAILTDGGNYTFKSI